MHNDFINEGFTWNGLSLTFEALHCKSWQEQDVLLVSNFLIRCAQCVYRITFIRYAQSCYLFSIPSMIYLSNKRQRIPKGQSKKDNPEQLATQGTQDEEKHSKNTTQYVVDFEIFVVFTVLLFSYICKQIKLT